MPDGPNLSNLSKTPPNPYHTAHISSAPTVYTCHAAALHWAFMDQGLTQPEANQKVTTLTQMYCPACNAPNQGGPHSSIPASKYGPMFCSNAVKITRNSLTDLEPGDILITGHHKAPNHSMIVRRNKRAGETTVRGFNNFGTLGTGRLLEYDPFSRNITQDKYWKKDDAGSDTFGVIPEALYRVTYQDYSNRIVAVMNMMKKRFGV